MLRSVSLHCRGDANDGDHYLLSIDVLLLRDAQMPQLNEALLQWSKSDAECASNESVKAQIPQHFRRKCPRTL
jgi:hypothetical protein